MRNGLFSILLTGLFAGTMHAQKSSLADSTIRIYALSAQLGAQVPFASLADRFGWGGLTGLSFIHKTNKNYTVEGSFGFFFGNIVKEDTILKPLMTSTDIFIGRDGNPVDVYLFQRGFLATAKVGKVIPVFGPNTNSGLHLAIGGGVMQHKIRIQEEFETLPQLTGPYKKGYDRMTNGWCLTQSVGYMHFSNYRFINYYIGFEMYEGFTMNRRSLNFDTQQRDTSRRFDVMGAFVVRWSFPIYKRQARDFYFY